MEFFTQQSWENLNLFRLADDLVVVVLLSLQEKNLKSCNVFVVIAPRNFCLKAAAAEICRETPELWSVTETQTNRQTK